MKSDMRGSVRGRWYTTAALVLASLACGSGEPPEEGPPVDGWAVAREFLTTDPDHCFADTLAYCLDDPDLVDPVLQEVVDRSYDGVMPTTEAGARRVAKRAGASWAVAQTATPEARAAVEQRIREAYEDPEVTVDGDTVTVHVGLLPGPLERTGRAGWGIVNPDHVDGGDWSGSEVLRFLRRFRDAHPDATTIALEVQVPRGAGVRGVEHHTWSWRADLRRIVLHDATSPNRAWYTDPIDDLDASAPSLDRGDLNHCTLTSKNLGDDPGCPL